MCAVINLIKYFVKVKEKKKKEFIIKINPYKFYTAMEF